MPEDDPLVRRTRCSDCAFTPGTNANKDEFAAIQRELCVATGTYFYCHRDAGDTHYLVEPEALCAGFVQAVTARIESGGIDRVSDSEREAAIEILDAIAEAGAHSDALFAPSSVHAK